MLGITSKERHIHLKMTVADFHEKCLFIVCDCDALFVFEVRWAVSGDQV
jgi:hypothetical protein